jgi:hypothetical protein
MCGESFNKADHIDCKIKAFEMKKIFFLHLAKSGSVNFKSSWKKLSDYTKLEKLYYIKELS